MTREVILFVSRQGMRRSAIAVPFGRQIAEGAYVTFPLWAIYDRVK